MHAHSTVYRQKVTESVANLPVITFRYVGRLK